MKANTKEFSKKEVLQRVGSIQQIAGSSRYILEEGKGKGTSMIRIRNGCGLDFNIIADKCLDIFDVSFKGHQLAWISKNGMVGNQHFEAEGAGWLRSFGGGMLTTCGLRNVGPPETDEMVSYGLHGRVSAVPARNVSVREYWEGETFFQEVSGEIRESNVFGENLVLYRTIKVNSERPVIQLFDRIINEGFSTEQLMILYHLNWGFPLFSEKSELIIDPINTQQRGKAMPDMGKWQVFNKPIHGFEEEVFFHDLKVGDNNKVKYILKNQDLGMGVEVSWDKSQLPWLSQWKMTGESDYVLGLEPSNSLPLGRKLTRERKEAEYLGSFQQKEIKLEALFFDV